MSNKIKMPSGQPSNRKEYRSFGHSAERHQSGRGSDEKVTHSNKVGVSQMDLDPNKENAPTQNQRGSKRQPSNQLSQQAYSKYINPKLN